MRSKCTLGRVRRTKVQNTRGCAQNVSSLQPLHPLTRIAYPRTVTGGGDTRPSVPIKYNNNNKRTTVVYVKRRRRSTVVVRRGRTLVRSRTRTQTHTHTRGHWHPVCVCVRAHTDTKTCLTRHGRSPAAAAAAERYTHARARAQPARMGRRRIKLISSHTCSRFPPCPMSIQCLRSSGSVRFA